MELTLLERMDKRGQTVSARTFVFSPGELALLEYPWKRQKHLLVFGVARGVEPVSGSETLVVHPSYTLDDLAFLGGVPIPNFRLNERYNDRHGRLEDLARRRYNASLIRELHVGSSKEIADALRQSWPEKEPYARIIEPMKPPYDWIRSGTSSGL